MKTFVFASEKPGPSSAQTFQASRELRDITGTDDPLIPFDIRSDDDVAIPEDWIRICVDSLIKRNVAVVWTPEDRIVTGLMQQLRKHEDLRIWSFWTPRDDNFGNDDLRKVQDGDGPRLIVMHSAAPLLSLYARPRSPLRGDPVLQALRDRSITILVWGPSPSLPGIERACVQYLNNPVHWMSILLEPFHGKEGYEPEAVLARVMEQRELWPQSEADLYASLREMAESGDLPAHLKHLSEPAGRAEAKAQVGAVSPEEAVNLLDDPDRPNELLFAFVCAFFPEIPISMVDDLILILRGPAGESDDGIAREPLVPRPPRRARLEPAQCSTATRLKLREEFRSPRLRRIFFRLAKRVQESVLLRSSNSRVRDMSIQLILDAAVLEPVGFGMDAFWRSSLAEIPGLTLGPLPLDATDWARLVPALGDDQRRIVIERAAAMWSRLIGVESRLAQQVFRRLLAERCGLDVLDIIESLKSWAPAEEEYVGEALRWILNSAPDDIKGRAARLIGQRARVSAPNAVRYLALSRSDSKEAVACGVDIFRELLQHKGRASGFASNSRWEAIRDQRQEEFSGELLQWFTLRQWKVHQKTDVLSDGVWFCEAWGFPRDRRQADQAPQERYWQKVAQAAFDQWVTTLRTADALILDAGVPALECMLVVEWSRALGPNAAGFLGKYRALLDEQHGAAVAHCLQAMSAALLSGAEVCVDEEPPDSARVEFLHPLRRLTDEIRESVVAHVTAIKPEPKGLELKKERYGSR